MKFNPGKKKGLLANATKNNIIPTYGQTKLIKQIQVWYKVKLFFISLT